MGGLGRHLSRCPHFIGWTAPGHYHFSPMTTRVGEVVEAIDRRVPFRTAAGWDAVGLQIGDRRRPVSRVAVVHELTDVVAERVLARRTDLVVTYHPLVFRPLRSITAAPGPEGRSFALLAGGISVIAVHTNWDIAAGGTADSLAEALGMGDVEGFAAVETVDGGAAWVGRHGSFDGGAVELVHTVHDALGCRPRMAGLVDRRIRRLAVLPGSGGSHLDDAIATAADAYVTGDISHHEARRALDSGMAVVDAGHAPTERPGVRALYALVAEIVERPVDLIGIDDNPWEVGWNR